MPAPGGLAPFSDKIENLVDLLENKINYPEKIKFKDRCDFSNLRNGIEKFELEQLFE